MLPVIQDGFGDRDPADFLINNIDSQIHPDDSVSLFLPMYIRCRWLLPLPVSLRTAMPCVRLQMDGYWPHSHCLRSECDRLPETSPDIFSGLYCFFPPAADHPHEGLAAGLFPWFPVALDAGLIPMQDPTAKQFLVDPLINGQQILFAAADHPVCHCGAVKAQSQAVPLPLLPCQRDPHIIFFIQDPCH